MGDTPIKDILFKGMSGCSSNNCLVKKTEGVGTNSGCQCIHKRGLANILFSRASQIDKYLTKHKE